MTEFTGIEYILIAIANAFGLDDKTWKVRIKFSKRLLKINEPESYAARAKTPFLYIKALKAYDDAINGVPTGYIMPLDATASGLQIIACLMGCKTTASQVNLINTGNREDVYRKVGKLMNLPRKYVKAPTMTLFYGSQAEPKAAFSPEGLSAFHGILKELVPKGISYLSVIKSIHSPEAEHYSFTMPNGYKVKVPVLQQVDKKVEVQELGKATFTFRQKVVKPRDYDVSLCANIVQAIDAYIVQETTERAKAQGFEMLNVFDSFWASPNHMNKVRRNYIEVLAELADSNLLAEIVSEITGSEITNTKTCPDLSKYILESEYPLS